MRIVIACNNDTIAEYLTNAGQQVKSLYANDLITQVIMEFPCDIFIYFSTIEAVIPHQEAIATIHKAGIRIIFVAPPDEPLIFYVAALGNADILLYPVTPETLLDRVVNPASNTEIAELMLNCKRALTTTETAESKTITKKETNIKDGSYLQPSSKTGSGFFKKLKLNTKKIETTLIIDPQQEPLQKDEEVRKPALLPSELSNQEYQAGLNNESKTSEVKRRLIFKPEIPSIKKPDLNRIISKMAPVSKGELPNLITVWSPAPAGKTFTAVNLAAAYVCRGYQTVLVSDDAFTHWLSLARPVPVLGNSYEGIIPPEVPGLTVLAHMENINGYRKLAEKNIVIVDGCYDTLQYASQIILVVDQRNLEQIVTNLDLDNLDWDKVWVLSNGVPEDEIEDMEAAIRLKVDYMVPFLPDNTNLVAILTEPKLTETFVSMAVAVGMEGE